MLNIGRPPRIDVNKGIVEIWNDREDWYEPHTFEFIEYLYDLIQKEKKDHEDYGV